MQHEPLSSSHPQSNAALKVAKCIRKSTGKAGSTEGQEEREAVCFLNNIRIVCSE